MPPSEDGSPSSRASPHLGTGLDSPDSEGNVWVDVRPPGTPGSLQGQQRARTSSFWSVISQALRRAQLAGAEVEEDMPYYSACHTPDTMDSAEYLTDSDTDTHTHTIHEPSRPATPESQASSSPRGRNDGPQPPPHTHTHDGGNSDDDDDDDDDDNNNTPSRRQQQQHPAWTWRTLLLVDDEADHLGLGAHNCAAIVLAEEDAASPAALRARVLAALARMARFSGAGHHGHGHGPGQPAWTRAEICIAWSLLPTSGAAAQVRGGWALTRLTALVAPAAGHGGQVDGDEDEDGDGDEAAWLGENLEVAASGLGGAFLVVRVVPCGAGGEGKEEEEEEVECYDEDDGYSIASDGALDYGGDQGREVLDYSIEDSRDVCLSPDFFGLHEC